MVRMFRVFKPEKEKTEAENLLDLAKSTLLENLKSRMTAIACKGYTYLDVGRNPDDRITSYIFEELSKAGYLIETFDDWDGVRIRW